MKTLPPFSFKEVEKLQTNSLRPQFFNEFIGQKKVVENLNTFIRAAKNRGESLDHILLYGPPGLGKTTLANIVAQEVGTKIHITSGPLLTKPGDLAAILASLQEKEILFIDEIHRLNNSVEEILYPALEDFAIDILIGEGPTARSIRINLPNFTLIGATTRLGLLTNPLRDRFGIPLKLEFYSYQEIALLLTQAANILKISFHKSGIELLAKCSRSTPRVALRLLKRVRDFLELEMDAILDECFVLKTLHQLGVDAQGLDRQDSLYLDFLFKNYYDKPVGVDTIATALSEKKDNIEETIEPYLVKIGFIHRTPRGRVLTEQAIQYMHVKNKLTVL